ncbi:MAG: chloride channel protein [Rubripirellula sp.]|nr:chloride channel protein [Rubripirellula sp.]
MSWVRKFFDDPEFFSSGKWIALSSIVGVVAGIVAIAFEWLGQTVSRWTLGELGGYSAPLAQGEHSVFWPVTTEFSPIMILCVMVGGGLVSGWLVARFAPEASGAGTDAAIEAFHRNRGEIRGRVVVVKTLASALTLGTGGSGGREGPIGQIGAAIGSWIGRVFRLSPRDRRIMMAAGMGAGVGAIFRAPLAGAVFAAEILYSDADLEADVIVPAATSSIVAYSLFSQVLPNSTRFLPIFGGELNHLSTSIWELLPYSILAVLLVLTGWGYVWFFHASQKWFARIPIPTWSKPALGALLAGCIGLSLYFTASGELHVLSVLGTGYGTLQVALTDSSSLGIPLLLTIAFFKIFTTAASIGSGGAGGVFGPSMVIGGTLGAAVGIAAHNLWPSVCTHPESFAVVGIAGFFAGVARAPLSTILMVRALTGDFGLLVPTTFVSTLAFVGSQRWRLYRQQVPTRMDSQAHRGDFIVDVLEGLRVGDVYRDDPEMVLIPEGMNLDHIVHRLTQNHQHYFPVVDHDGQIVGIFTDDDVRTYLYDDVLWELVVARDIMVTDFVSVSPEDDLDTAMRAFTFLNLDELPVIAPDSPGKLLGMLRRREAIAAYNHRVMEHKNARAEELA